MTSAHSAAPRLSLVRRALGGHAAIGLLASALLYVISLTGTLAVVHDQWSRWEHPGVAEMTALTPAAAHRALATAAGEGRTTVLTLQMPGADLPRAVVTTDRGSRWVDAAGRPGAARLDGWSEFVVELHETLHLPASWGMIVVGALGIALAALAVTGVIAHPRILREAFTLRSRHNAAIARVDWHNRLGVWTLPFVLAVTLTGAFLGLASVGATLIVGRDGTDVAHVYAPVFGPPPKSDAAPAPFPDVGAALATLAQRVPGVVPTYVVVRGVGTRGQDVQVYAAHPRRLIFGESYLFDAGGRWQGAAGLADGTVGQQVAASTYDLHFGNFGGPLVEVAYVLLGLCLCAVTATGTSIWLGKRRVRGHDDRRAAAAWAWIVWGTPATLLACLWAGVAAGAAAPFGALFWGLLAAGLAVALVRPATIEERWLATALGIATGITGIAHAAIARPWLAGPLAIGAGLVATAAVLLLIYRTRRRTPRLGGIDVQDTQAR